MKKSPWIATTKFNDNFRMDVSEHSSYFLYAVYVPEPDHRKKSLWRFHKVWSAHYSDDLIGDFEIACQTTLNSARRSCLRDARKNGYLPKIKA